MNKYILLLVFFTIAFNSFGCIKIINDTFDENLTVIQEKSFPISEGKLFKLTTPSGKISISEWDKNEVYIKVLGNERAKEKMEFRFRGNSDVVEVMAKSKSINIGFVVNNSRVAYEIKVPKNFNTEAKTSGGDIYIENDNGKHDFSTSGGNVSAKNINGEFSGSTSGGDFRIDKLSGKINIETSGGNINAKDFTGEFTGTTSGGDISLIAKDCKINSTTSGGNISLQYTGDNKGISLNTSGGNIDIQIPKDFNASARLETSGGTISSEFKGNNAVKITKNKFQSDLNNGGEKLFAETSGGNISLRSK